MGDRTGISWCDATWNPTTGCTKVSAGCKHCYAERVFPRAYGKERKFTDVRVHPERLDQPLRWKKPRRIFVNSMSDLFHEAVPGAFIDQVFAVMALAPQHCFQVLTKRPARMLTYCQSVTFERLRHWMNLASDGGEHRVGHYNLTSIAHRSKEGTSYQFTRTPPPPLPNVWLGVSVEDQATTDERIPLLLQTPAAVRFVSYEPALGPVSFRWAAWEPIKRTGSTNELDGLRRLDWLIVGGESGPRARPSDPAWFRGVLAQCHEAGVPLWMKQLGGYPNPHAELADFPPDLRVQEFPKEGTR